jgi:hypothetical protein
VPEKNGLMASEDREGLNRYSTLPPEPVHGELVAYQLVDAEPSLDASSADAATDGDGGE